MLTGKFVRVVGPAVVGLCFLVVHASAQAQEEILEPEDKGWSWRLESAWAVLRGDSPEPRFRFLFRRDVDKGYLPTFGPTPLRFGYPDTFDRNNLVSLDSIFAPKLEELAEKLEPVDDELEVPPVDPEAAVADVTSEEGVEDAKTSPLAAGSIATPPPVEVPATTTETIIMANAPLLATRQQENLPALDPRLVLKFFEPNPAMRQDASAVAVPFVMPFQNTPPLIIESEATYQQVESPQ